MYYFIDQILSRTRKKRISREITKLKFMKVKILAGLLVSLLVLNKDVISQEKTGVIPIGYYVDARQNEVNDYVDLDYDAPTDLYHSFSNLTSYSPGSYYDVDGNKHIGEIKRIDVNKTISFRENKEMKPVKLRAADCSALTIGVDSFIVRNNIIVSRGLGPQTITKPQFLGVVVDNDEMTVLKHIFSGSQYINTYIVHLKKSSVYVDIPKKNSEFINVIAPMIKPYTYLYNQVRSGKLDYDDFGEIVASYDYYLKFKNGTAIYLTQNWNETKDMERAVFKGVIRDERDSVFTITYQDLSGNLVAKGDYSSFFPSRKNGEFEWYYPEGAVRKKGTFLNNEPDGVFTVFYPNGKKYQDFTVDDGERKYKSIWDEKGDLVVQNGSGVILINDEVKKRQLTRSYEQGKLINSYFEDENGTKVYQKMGDQIALKKAFINNIKEKLKYSLEALKANAQGNVLVSLTIDERGMLEAVELSRGVQTKQDNHVISTIKSYNSFKVSKPIRVKKEKVKQEVLLPISFRIPTDFIKQRYYYYDHFFHHQQMMMYQPVNVTPPPVPGRF